ncbi:GNAT family acetyltransferase [Oleiphilus sp. HI0009]|uniref:GNAT family N-acetyltransferase n=1 Tax=unclassified Oleiphilus TaxID=2631174 RepID=UPI0007C3E097
MHSSLTFRSATPSDTDRCFQIEQEGYAGDEAATREKIQQRIETYPEGFLVLEKESQIIGFINCGACFDVSLSDEEFKELIGHDPIGPNIVVMSVVVYPDFQHQGYATALMHEFIAMMQAMQKSAMYLICQEELVGFYQQFGFVDDGTSESSHGGLRWNDMHLVLSN